MALHPDPDLFSYYSGYGSFKQLIGDFTGTLVVSGTVSATIPNNYKSIIISIPVPETAFSVELYMQSSVVNPGRRYLVENLQIENLVRAGSSNYNLEINMATTTNALFIECAVNNPTGGTLTLVTENLLFDAKIFISPFV